MLALEDQDDPGGRRMDEPSLFAELDRLLPALLRTAHGEIGTIARGTRPELVDAERDHLARILNFVVCPPFGGAAPVSWHVNAATAFPQICELAAALYAAIRLPASRSALANLIADMRQRAQEVRHRTVRRL